MSPYNSDSRVEWQHTLSPKKKKTKQLFGRRQLFNSLLSFQLGNVSLIILSEEIKKDRGENETDGCF